MSVISNLKCSFSIKLKPNYRNSSKSISVLIQNRNSIKANFRFSEIGNALRNQLLESAPTHLQINLCTVQYTLHYTSVCIAAHSAQRVANRFCNNM